MERSEITKSGVGRWPSSAEAPQASLGAKEPPGGQGRVSAAASECKCRLCEAGIIYRLVT